MKTIQVTLRSVLLGLILVPALLFGQARVQVIHNSADAAASVVDVWLNNTLLIDNFAFRTASPFINAPAGVDFDVVIQPSTSTDTTNALARFTYNLADGETYVLVANGIVVPAGYNPATPFNIYVYPMGRETASNPSNTDLLVFHGSTDAPVVDVVEVGAGAGTIVNDLNYASFAGYLELPTSDYSLQVRDQTGTTTVAQFSAPLATLGLNGASAVVVASGFLNPSNNNNGAAFGLYVALASGGNLVALPSVPVSTARLQVIHNSADAAASTVDVWLNNTLLLDNFAFRSASPFIDAPAGVNFDVVIQPSTSTDTVNALARFTYNLTGGSKYILVANGIVVPAGYMPAPPFNIFVYDMGREFANSSSNTDLLVFHGSTDASIVDVVEVGVGAGTLVDNLVYSHFNGYLELPTSDYSLQIRDQSGTSTVAQFAAPLSTLGLNGAAAVVVASGFLNPGNNNNGPAFGLYVALPTGGNLVALPSESISTARLQVIHNSADAAASQVDVWLNNTLLLDNFAFRTASPFIDAPAGVDFDVVIQPSSSTDTTNALARFTYNLTGGSKYILVANGIVAQTGYNPPSPFNLYVYDMGREFANSQLNSDVLVFHGSTDAPVVDIVETGIGAGTIVDNIPYGSFAGYLELPGNNYVLDVRDESGTVTVASYQAPLVSLGLQGQAMVIVASGFLDPTSNNNGAAFGLFVAVPWGGELIELDAIPAPARLQVIHNSADAAAETVDVWLNNTLLIDDFTFRTASPFINAPAGIDFDVVIQPSTSADTSNALARFTYNLGSGNKYILVANGIVNPSGYTPATPFDLYVYDMGREVASDPANTDVLVFHGATDAPTVDVVEVAAGAGTIVDNLSYGQFAGYLELPTANYQLEVRDETGTVTVGTFNAALEALGLQGKALAVVASGFLSPASNNNGPEFGLFAVLPDGGDFIALGNTTGLSEIQLNNVAVRTFPNPVSDYLTIEIASESGNTTAFYGLFSIDGKNIKSGSLAVSKGIQQAKVNVSDLPSGIYLVKTFSGNEQYINKVMIN
jgi:hypothetical protein